jgi:hypothetical protein
VLQVQLFLKKVHNYQSLNVLHSLKDHVTGYRCITFLEGLGQAERELPGEGLYESTPTGRGKQE